MFSLVVFCFLQRFNLIRFWYWESRNTQKCNLSLFLFFFPKFYFVILPLPLNNWFQCHQIVFMAFTQHIGAMSPLYSPTCCFPTFLCCIVSAILMFLTLLLSTEWTYRRGHWWTAAVKITPSRLMVNAALAPGECTRATIHWRPTTWETHMPSTTPGKTDWQEDHRHKRRKGEWLKKGKTKVTESINLRWVFYKSHTWPL